MAKMIVSISHRRFIINNKNLFNKYYLFYSTTEKKFNTTYHQHIPSNSRGLEFWGSCGGEIINMLILYDIGVNNKYYLLQYYFNQPCNACCTNCGLKAMTLR